MKKTNGTSSGMAVKRVICMLLVVASLLSPVVTLSGTDAGFGLVTTAEAGYYNYSYYAKCNSRYSSLVDALNSIGVNSSFSNRKSIAALNGYSSYSGTAAQNTALLNLLKNGKLVKSKTWVNDSGGNSSVTYYPKCNSRYSSLVDALNSIGVTSSFSNRKSIAALNGYSNYSGTAAQNTALLNLLKNGKLIKSKGSTPVPKPAASTLKIGSGSYSPGTLTKGQAYYTSGTVSSNYKITSVTVGIYKSNGSSVYVRSASPNSTSYNISNLDSYMKFGSLSTGSYVFKVIAKDAYPVTKTLVSNSFTVVNPPSTKRSKTLYNNAIDKVNVYNYKKSKNGTTYCNIFVQDVVDKLGLKNSYVKQLANDTYDWLNKNGTSNGWKKVTASKAQQRANSGYPTIVIWKNTSGPHGHVAIVRPETSNYTYSSSRGPVIANAGASTFAYGNVKDGFGSRAVQYWTHD